MSIREDIESVKEDIKLYKELSGEDGSQETIATIGAYLRGYRQGKEDAEPHWIPVTERLPEKSGRYFVTERIYHINDKEHTGGFILKTDFAEYSATEKKWRRAQALVVVAWMDNEPYKGE